MSASEMQCFKMLMFLDKHTSTYSIVVHVCFDLTYSLSPSRGCWTTLGNEALSKLSSNIFLLLLLLS
jgi:hypothetical protein